jgi:tetratricopeptide (TPR) repeat protein
MPDPLGDIVKFRGDRLFNGAVNIGWFGTDDARTRAAASAFVFHGPAYHGVSQADVGVEHGHRLQDTASFARSIVRRCYGIEDQPFTLAIAGYGTGKSHLGLTLAALLSQPTGKISDSVLVGIDAADRAMGSDIREILAEAQQPCLVVALNGMQNFDLTTEVTRQILVRIKAMGLDTRPLDDLRPRFAQAASLIRMASANSDVTDELLAACEVGEIKDVLSKLDQQDESVYSKVHKVLAGKNIRISALGGESIRDVIAVAVREYCGPGKAFRSLAVLFDEFGRYTEFATVRSHIAGSGVLQDLFEGIQANAGTACFAGFIQFELNAYVQRVSPEHRNEILRYVTRYQAANRVYLSINLETLIASLIEKKKPKNLAAWFDNENVKRTSSRLAADIARWFPQSRNHRLWSDPVQFHGVIRKGCWPLSVYSTWFLFHLAAAGKHLQERSALALLGDVFDRFQKHSVGGDGSWTLAPVDLWSDALQHELITSEESGQQGSIAHAYASVNARHGARLGDDLKGLLRAAVLASKMGLKATDRNDAVKALSELAGLQSDIAERGIRLLQDEYNVLEWDEAFKEFDILGDAVPRTQFLSFVRQRVASTYDEAGKAALFATKAATWCDLLGDLDCDFAEENKITTREWRYQGVTSNLDVLPMQVKLASDRWKGALGVDEPRGTIVYCYVEPSRDVKAVATDAAKLLRAASKESGVSAQAILVVFLCDEEGVLGQSLAELAVLDESISNEDRVRFGHLVPAHQEKTREVVRSQVESMIKRRLYVTSFREPLGAQKLSRAGTELFARIYSSAVVFPFDGFSTARGNAADSCQELTAELLLGRLDYDAVMGKPVKVKNRAVSVLKNAWGIFAQNGNVRTRPSQPVLRTLTEKWDEMLVSGERRIPIENAIRQLCAPPYGANIASAGLFLGVFVAPRVEKLSVIRAGQSYAISQWVRDEIFRGKFIDVGALHDVELVLLGEESSEWEILLDEWEQAESHFARGQCLERALKLKSRVPVPPALAYRAEHLQDQGRASIKAIQEKEGQEDEAIKWCEKGIERRDVSILSRAASTLSDMSAQMKNERPLWTDHQIEDLQPHLLRARQAIVHFFPAWLVRQAPVAQTPDAVGEFKHKMLHLICGNLNNIGLNELSDKIETHTSEVVRNVETVAEAQQLIRDIRNWMTAHGDARRFVRVVELRALRQVGKEYIDKLKGLSARIKLPDIGDVRGQLLDSLEKMKEAEKEMVRRAEKLWESKISVEEDVHSLLTEIDSLISVFENCQSDLEDLQLMRRALKFYQELFHQLSNEQLSWHEFEASAAKSMSEAQSLLGDSEIPWPPDNAIVNLVTIVSEHRKKKSCDWITALGAEIATLSSKSAPDANRLHVRASSPPAFLTEEDAIRLGKIVKTVEDHLNFQKLEWLVEKFKELPPAMRRKFLDMVSETVKG